MSEFGITISVFLIMTESALNRRINPDRHSGVNSVTLVLQVFAHFFVACFVCLCYLYEIEPSIRIHNQLKALSLIDKQGEGQMSLDSS